MKSEGACADHEQVWDVPALQIPETDIRGDLQQTDTPVQLSLEGPYGHPTLTDGATGVAPPQIPVYVATRRPAGTPPSIMKSMKSFGLESLLSGPTTRRPLQGSRLTVEQIASRLSLI